MNVQKDDVSGLYYADIDGKRYEWEKWGAEESLDTLMELVSVLGKPVAAVMFQATQGDLASTLRSIDLTSTDKMTAHLTEQLATNRPTLMRLIKKLTSGKTLCDGRAISSFDRHYQDQLPHMFRVVRAALEVQYGNFFAAIGTAVGISRAEPNKTATSGPTPTPSTSGSGAPL